MDEAEEKRYTIEEAVAELVRRDCAIQGHPPTEHSTALGDHIGCYHCLCTAVTWVPNA